MFLPPKLLSLTITDIQSHANWTVANPDDPWVGNPYQWQVTFQVNAQAHSSPASTMAYYYTGNDVGIGDWVSDLASGAATQIISIVSQNPSVVVVIVEDIDRYNTFTDASGQGNGIGGSGAAYCFGLGDDGIPVLTPMSTLYTALAGNLAWQLDQISRFRFRNLLHSYYRVDQPGHGFALGDLIYLQSSGSYAKIVPTNATVVSCVGTVSDIGTPGPDWFAFRPVGRVVSTLSPALPGNPGDLIYVASDGTLTTTAPSAWARPVYIRLAASTGIVLDRSVQTPADMEGYINKTLVVPNNAALATLPATNIGDQVLVEDAGSGEWSHMIKHSDGNFKLMVNQDASHVDAETIEATVTGNSDNTVTVGNISAGRCVTTITVTVTEAFGTDATLIIGSSTFPDTLLSTDQVDLSVAGSYVVNPNRVFTDAYTAIIATLDVTTADAGSAVINVTYT